MSFVLIVEGDTERAVLPPFFKRWLDPQLKKPIKIQATILPGYAEFQKSLAAKARTYLSDPNNRNLTAVIGLLDLYGPPYPTARRTIEDKQAWLVERCSKSVNNPRFRMFVAVHDLEAWLLADPSIFPQAVCRALQSTSLEPEQVDDSSPPAKLLDALYKQYVRRAYRKTTDGPQLFKKLDPENAANVCPHLKSMLEEMLKLAQVAGL